MNKWILFQRQFPLKLSVVHDQSPIDGGVSAVANGAGAWVDSKLKKRNKNYNEISESV